jgi:NADPH:quinone reductase-like Zn-dependent oxidoreductase
LVAAPIAVPLAEAAAIPVAGLAAWQAVFEHANVRPGERVLINGAGGGIGGFAVQFAKHAAAHVVATVSPRSSAAVRRYGADQLIDYTAVALRESLDGPVDVILNLTTRSPAQAAALVPIVRNGGRIVSAATPIEPTPDAAVTDKHMIARNDLQHLTAMVRLIDDGDLTVEAAESHPLADLPLIHRRSEHGDTHGKIIITP